MIGYRADPGFKLLIYVYSFLAHMLIFFCAVSFVQGAGSVKPEIIDLKKSSKMPFSFKVSLTGRKGNTYDASKKIDGADIDKIKKNIFDNLNSMKQKFDLAKASIPEVPKIAEKPDEKKIETPVPEMIEKKTVSEKKVLDAEKPAEKPKKADKKKKEKTESKELAAEDKLRIKERHPATEKDKKDEVEKTAKDIENKENIGNKTNVSETMPPAASNNNANSGSGEAGSAVYGNMSGDRNSGSDIAGSPDGKADASIELNRVELFKSLVSEKIKKGVKYPERCRKLGIEGKVRLSFEIARNGKVLNAGVNESSGNDEIDASAIAAVRSGEPFLPFPQNAGGETIKFVIPLNYELNEE